MPDIREVFQNLMAQFLNQMNEFVVKLGPGILFAIGIIFVGWIIAIIIKTIISKLIRAFGFDILCEKIGFKAFLLKGEITKKPSQMVGLLFYWIVFLTALVIASEAIDMKITAEFMTRTILYIPKLIVATIFIGLAIFIGRFIYNVVEKTMHLANMPFYRLLGSGARYIIIGFAVMLAIQYLGFTSSAVTEFFVVIFIVIPLLFFLAFVVGGKDLIESVLCRKYVIKEYRQGDIVSFDSITGEVEKIDLVSTTLKSGDKEILVPNVELARKIVKRQRRR